MYNASLLLNLQALDKSISDLKQNLSSTETSLRDDSLVTKAENIFHQPLPELLLRFQHLRRLQARMLHHQIPICMYLVRHLYRNYHRRIRHHPWVGSKGRWRKVPAPRPWIRRGQATSHLKANNLEEPSDRPKIKDQTRTTWVAWIDG